MISRNLLSNFVKFLPLAGLVAFYFDSSFIELRMLYPRLDSDSLYTIFLIGFTSSIIVVVGLLYIIHSSLRNRVLGRLFLFNVVVTISQLVIIGILVVTLFQYQIEGTYSFTNVEILLILSYGTGLFFAGLSAVRFIGWYNYERKAVVLGYGLVMCVIILFLLSSVAYAAYEIFTPYRLQINSPDLTIQISGKNQDPNIFGFIYYYSYILTFLSVWTITLLFLKSRLGKVNPILFYSILFVPLLYFLLPLIPQFSASLAKMIVRLPYFYSTFYLLFFSGTGTIGGIIFATALLLFARKFEDRAIKMYLLISAIGMLLFFISNQSPPLAEDVSPPFGLVSKSFVGLSCYMIFLGFYSIVVYLTRKDKLTTTVVAQMSKDDLFGSLVRSEQEKSIESIVNRSMAILQEQQEVESKELSLSEINDIIAIVKRELSTSQRKED
jgi:hypothetical protein